MHLLKSTVLSHSVGQSVRQPRFQPLASYSGLPRRQNRQFMGFTKAGLFDGITKLFSKDVPATGEGSNKELLKWARQASPQCPLAPGTAPEGLEIATFAGGCFWGLELAYQRVEGVTQTSVGYIGGKDPAPNYESVCSGRTGHAEAVQVYYDPKECTYERLLEEFFSKVDPTTLNRQGNDRGTQYRSVIYYHTPEQKELAEKWVSKVNGELAAGTFRRVVGDKVLPGVSATEVLINEIAPCFDGPFWLQVSQVVTPVEAATDYFLAEKYHQQYLARGGRLGMAQSAEKGNKDPIRCAQ